MILFQIRRGTDAQRLTVVFNAGEFVYTTDTKLLYIGDGATAGGILIGGELQVRGTMAIPNGVNSVTVTGLGLAAIPTLPPVVSISKLTGGLNLFGSVRKDSVTTDGFTVDLSAATDSVNYNLDYLLSL